MLAEDRKVGAVVHPPYPLLAHLADKPLDLRDAEIRTEPREEGPKALRIVGVHAAVEHVVLALVPEDRLQLVAHALPIQLRQRLPH